jgi:hypothetical protein
MHDLTVTPFPRRERAAQPRQNRATRGYVNPTPPLLPPWVPSLFHSRAFDSELVRPISRSFPSFRRLADKTEQP